MSVYSRQIALLEYVESIQKDDPKIAVRFVCSCSCEAMPAPVHPKSQHFATIPEVRAWLANHMQHDFSVQLFIEGMSRDSHSRDNAFLWEEPPWDELSAEKPTRATWTDPKRLAIIQKLKALALGTPYEHEADSALRKIRAMEHMGIDNPAPTDDSSGQEIDESLFVTEEAPTEPALGAGPTTKRPPDYVIDDIEIYWSPDGWWK